MRLLIIPTHAAPEPAVVTVAVAFTVVVMFWNELMGPGIKTRTEFILVGTDNPAELTPEIVVNPLEEVPAAEEVLADNPVPA